MILLVDGIPVGTLGGGARKRFTGLPAIPLLLHSYDFSDPDQLWQDVAATIPVVADGDPILAVTNKGFDGTILTEDALATTSVIYKTGIANGASVGRFDGTALLSGVVVPGTTNAQVTLAVASAVSGGTADSSVFGWDSAGAAFRYRSGPANRRTDMLNGGVGIAPNPGSTIPLNEFNWGYAAIDSPTPAVNNYVGNDSSIKAELIIGAFGTTPAVDPGTDLVIGSLVSAGFPPFSVFIGDILEILVWDGFLSFPQRAQIPIYFNAKYGVMPF